MIIHFKNKSIASVDLKKWKNKDFFLSADELIAANFIEDWLAGISEIKVNTSGSTGNPKQITINRELLIISAQNTLKSLNIKTGGNALLCINPRYIGGIMMLVRALCHDLDLHFRALSSNPLTEPLPSKIDLCAMVPAQVFEILKDEKSRKNLEDIENLLIGGGAIDPTLSEEISRLPGNIYHTYGMTETISHVALKKINSRFKEPFEAVGDNVFEVNENNQLIISGAVTHHKKLLTNDVVHLINERKFEWIGRIDHVINSGGIKLFPEQIEQKLAKSFTANGINNRFFITGQKDEKFGEVVTLVIEGEINEDRLKLAYDSTIEKYEKPKKMLKIDKFAETATGKINRPETLNLIHEIRSN